MKWVLVTEAAKAKADSLVPLDTEKVKHLRKVMRMEWGEVIQIADGAGKLYEGRLEKMGDGGGVSLGKLSRSEDQPAIIELVIGMPKNPTMDWLVEKAVECGVTEITPVVTSRSVVKPEPGGAEKYLRRWQAIMDGALEQSEHLWRASVCPPKAWRDWCATAKWRGSVAFVSETRLAQSDRQALSECWTKLLSAAKSATGMRVFIGPEGGISDGERDELQKMGFALASLGTSVLRVETAVVSALTLVRLARNIS